MNQRVGRESQNKEMPDPDPRYADLLSERVAQARTQREALVTAIEEMRTARSLTFADDEHDPEGSTVSLDQARDAALLDRTEQTLTELTAAQQRLASGRYGVCERCGRPIPTERLLARPEARHCVPCSARARARGGPVPGTPG
jgi:DnaK suppressor protein